MTTSYCSRLASVKTELSSDVVTVKSLEAASCWIAVVASSMLECRKAAVSEKRSASNDPAAAASTAADVASAGGHGTALPSLVGSSAGADFWEARAGPDVPSGSAALA